MPISGYEKARSKVQQHLHSFLDRSGKNNGPRPISEKSALFRSMKRWESFFPGHCFPMHEMFWWMDLIDQSRRNDPQAIETAKMLLDWVEGSEAILYVPPKKDSPWCQVDLKAKIATIVGQIFHIDSIPALRIVERLSQATAERPISSSELRTIPGCWHERQVRRFLGMLPPEIKRLIQPKKGAGGGRWMVPPLRN